ncbi:exodeoxyribonuclease-3 [Sphingobium sp. B7D2B]|uniref:exodeoxyribonuclease III n=1 Tax=Sphingobium sp. B7D2B TaxID=2940583 RepID=UPI002225853E|nr:exodeoxyribonuclease III [Sphingobium sp. B7D2B]MCW2364937.1 exodeoxyribonuclease-3 [Sphingobium sp. B7D2B]
MSTKQTLKIASWNINSVRARLEIVERFLTEYQPDVLCMQETKVVDGSFPEGLFRRLGYNHQVLNGQPMHHGVAIVSRIPVREDERLDWQANGEARHIGVRLENGLRIENVYVPAGGEEPDRTINRKFGQKLDFLQRMIDWSGKLGGSTLLLGDFNVAPLECDVWSHKQLINVVSHTQIERDLLGHLQSSHNWIDLGRRFVPAPERLYTWWSYRAQDWAKSDRGRRLDHMWLSPDLAETAVSHQVAEGCRSWTRPSDHAPLITEFAF